MFKFNIFVHCGIQVYYPGKDFKKERAKNEKKKNE